ncbi:MAG TPA: DinB family protein [Gemmatimonadales bacterium]
MSRNEGSNHGSFEQLPDLVFGPLAGRPDADWHRAPPGKWTPAQIAEHLAIGLDATSRRFAERGERPPMTRRSRSAFARLAEFFILGLGWYPQGWFAAPEGTRPTARPDASAVERKFRDSHARFIDLARTLLPRRRADLFVKHPVLGDLTLEEWLRFHVVHSAHHVKQIRDRLAP